MKKFIIFTTAQAFLLLALISCQKMQTAAKVVPDKAEDMLRFLPGSVNAVFFVDFHTGINLEFIDKIIEDEENYAEYQEFVTKTGIDPQKDVYYLATAMRGNLESQQRDVVAIVNLKYDRDALLAALQKEAEKDGETIEEEAYNGFVVYSGNGKEKDKTGSFTFLTGSHVALGTTAAVKSVIDVVEKKEENVLENKAFTALFARTDRYTLVWGGVIVPPESRSLIAANPILSGLENVTAISAAFDYKNENIILDLKLIGDDPIKNQELADRINGFKSLGAMIQIQDLSLAELMDRIEITSASDHVRIYASIPQSLPETLLDKLKLEKSRSEEKIF